MYFLYIFFLFSLFYSYFKYSNNFRYSFLKKILLFFGYKIDNIDIKKLPSKLIIIGSHTSIYDFFIGIIFYYAIMHKRYSTYVCMKHSFEIICKPILLLFDEKFKLISINTQKKGEGITSQICNKLRNEDNYIIFIAPEGTRKCTETLRSG
jgi:1-acyl-sn-glycerol-3-phosphate acyltransferase